MRVFSIVLEQNEKSSHTSAKPGCATLLFQLDYYVLRTYVGQHLRAMVAFLISVSHDLPVEVSNCLALIKRPFNYSGKG